MVICGLCRLGGLGDRFVGLVAILGLVAGVGFG